MNNFGRLAEMKAANYMRKKGYTLLDHSYKSRFGEIDLIMMDKKNIVFVEVKARNDNSIASPREFVDEYKQRKIATTASLYLSLNKIKEQPRFDIIEIYMDKNEIKSIKHLENAFSL